MNTYFKSTVLKTVGTRKPLTRSQGARTLFNHQKEILFAHQQGLTDQKILKSFKAMKTKNPLRGLKATTAKVYIAQARLEWGLRKNHTSI